MARAVRCTPVHRSRESGLPLTILRPGAFAANARTWFPAIEAERVVRLPFPELHLTPIHEADLAAAAITALDDPAHIGKVYPSPGPNPCRIGSRSMPLPPPSKNLSSWSS
ncbi:hypothetical protein AB4305_21725 [Nocardia sp. 2YAB30]|uniref:hypothetical protein n=1 Tax=Nocardia sp. 2YAB30 TaxID=3233022 RepID=UPI003F9A0E86